jgi:hypothetical protein
VMQELQSVIACVSVGAPGDVPMLFLVLGFRLDIPFLEGGMHSHTPGIADPICLQHW